MTYSFKRYLSYFLAIIISAGCFPVIGISAKEQNRLFRIDFEKENQYDFSRGGDQVSIVNIDPEKGKSLCFKPVSTAEIQKNLDEPVNGGIIRLSLDYMSAQEDNPMMYVRFFNSALKSFSTSEQANMFETLVITKSIGYYINSQGWKAGGEKMTPEPNRWYRIEVWFDMTARKTYYMIDGEFFAGTGMVATMTDIAGVVIHGEKNTGGKFYVDNVELQAMTEKEAIELYKNGEAVPYDIAGEVSFEFNSGKPGHIYYDKDKQEFSAKLRNKTEETREVTINCQIDEREAEKVKVSLEPLEEKIVTVTAKARKYGFFTVKSWLSDTMGTSISKEISTRFSVAHAPKEGVHDPNLGITIHATADHIKNHGDPVLNMELAERAGFGFVRNEVWWRYYEKEKGVYKFPAKYAEVVQRAKELDLDIIPILSYQNPAVAKGNPPSSPEALDLFGKFAVAYKKDLGSVTKEMSVWNEYNHPGFNKDKCPPSSYADMLKAVYTSLKKEAPGTFVWGLVTAGVDDAFIRQVLDAGGGEYMDGVDVHTYYNKQTPESGGIVRDINRLKGIMKEYGIEDKPIYMSENGWASVGKDGYADDYEQAAYNVRVLNLCKAYDLCDKYAYYTINNGGLNAEQEQRFGLVKAYNDEIPYEAKPSYLSMCNYNALMIGSEFKEMMEYDNDVTAYRYKLADGRDCVMIYSEGGFAAKGIKLGTGTAEVYDMFGNVTEYGSVDNIFSLSLSYQPIYIVGNFSEFSVEEPIIYADKAKANIVNGDCAEINITEITDEALTIETETGKHLTVEENNGFADGKAKIVFRSDMEGKGSEDVFIRIIKDNICIYKTSLKLNYSEPVEISLLGAPYNAKQLSRWQARFELKSNSYSQPQSGIMKITAPAELAKVTGPIRIVPIYPGESRVIKVNIPLALNGKIKGIEANVELDSGAVLSISRGMSLECCVYAKEKPVIDGVVNNDEWQNITRMKMVHKGTVGARFVSTQKITYGGDEDLSAYAYTMWDEDNFYLALQVKDDVWEHDKEGTLWKSDGVQFGMAPELGSTQLMVADVSYTDEKKFVLETSPVDANIGSVKNADYEIKRNGNITTYEICVPWLSLFPDGFTPAANKPMAFSIMINDNDGDGRRGFLEYGSGIGSGMQTSTEFLNLYLLGEAR